VNQLSAPAGVAFVLAGGGTAAIAVFPEPKSVRYALPLAYAVALLGLSRSPLTRSDPGAVLRGVIGLALVAVVVYQPLLGYDLPRQNFIWLALPLFGVALYAMSVVTVVISAEYATVRRTAVVPVAVAAVAILVPGLDWLLAVGVAVVGVGIALALAAARFERDAA